MSARPHLLPDAFADLDRFVSLWALETTDDRHHRRQIAPMAEIQAFYDAMLPRMAAIFDHLDRKLLEALPEEDRTLLRLATAFPEAALSVELFASPGVTDAPYPHGVSVSSELPELRRALASSEPGRDGGVP